MAPQDTGPPDWARRRMTAGDWVDPEASGSRKRADKVFSIRATEAEVAEFDERIAALDITRSQALRIAMRRIAGFVEVNDAVTAELREATRQIGGIARNVNQIARAANRTRDPDYIAFLEERRALGKELSRVEAQMQRILSLAARREDGLARLEKAAGE